MTKDPGFRPEAATDEARCGDAVLRALVMTLLVAYYRNRPGDTRFETAALAALPAEHRAVAAAQLGRIIAATKKVARQAEAQRRHERDARPVDRAAPTALPRERPLRVANI